MWHVRPDNANWAMVSCYFFQLMRQNQTPSFYADGQRYPCPWTDVDQVTRLNTNWDTLYFTIFVLFIFVIVIALNVGPMPLYCRFIFRLMKRTNTGVLLISIYLLAWLPSMIAAIQGTMTKVDGILLLGSAYRYVVCARKSGD